MVYCLTATVQVRKTFLMSTMQFLHSGVLKLASSKSEEN